MTKRELTLEFNEEILLSDAGLTAMAELILQFGVDRGLFKKGAIKKNEQTTKVLSLRPRSEREKLRQKVGRGTEESCNSVHGRSKLLRIKDA